MALQNRSQPGQEKTIQFAHTSATTAKLPCVFNARAFIPLNTADANVVNAFYYSALVSDVPKATGAAWSVGDALYWDDAAKNFTKTSAGNTACGYALAAAQSADAIGGLVEFISFP